MPHSWLVVPPCPFFSDKRKCNSLNSLSTFLCFFHCPPHGHPMKWTTLNHSHWKISLSSEPDFLCVPTCKLLGIKEVSACGSSSCLSLYGFSWFTEKRKYSRDFLLRFRFCSIACQRPVGLLLMEGVTDTKPGNGN